MRTGAISDSGWNASEINELVWIPGSDTGILYINGTNEEVPGGVTLWIGDLKSPKSRWVALHVSMLFVHTDFGQQNGRFARCSLLWPEGREHFFW